LNYYASVASYFLFGIFTCPAHQFEVELKLDVYKRAKVALKEKDIANLKNILADLEDEAYQDVWNKAVADDKVELLIMMMNARPLLNLGGLDKNDYALFERNIDLPLNRQFLLRQYHAFRDGMECYGVEAKEFFKRIRLKLMSPYEVLCDDLSTTPLQEFSELYSLLSPEQKESVWYEAMVKKNVACVELLLREQCAGVFREEYLQFLVEHQLQSIHIRNYLTQQWQNIPLKPAHYQAFLRLVSQKTYVPSYMDYQILKRMSVVAPLESDYVEVVREFEMHYLHTKKSEIKSFDIHQIVDAESEWVFAFKKMQSLKKEKPKNKEWDEILAHLSQNQSLMAVVTNEPQQHQVEVEQKKFRPLGGAIGPTLKNIRKGSMFSKSANFDEATQEQNLNNGQKATSSRNLI
jgi:hypothetical protein